MYNNKLKAIVLPVVIALAIVLGVTTELFTSCLHH